MSGARAWQRMLSGRRLDLLDPSPLDIELEDVAHGLSRVARWNGQTAGSWAFSVAQHSLFVEALAAQVKPGLMRRWRLAALLHDAPEYVVGDLISPFKAAVGGDYRSLEGALLRAVRLRVGLPAAIPEDVEAAIKTADRRAAWIEATALAGFSEAEADVLFDRPPSPWPALEPQPPDAAKAAFLERCAALGAAA